LSNNHSEVRYDSLRIDAINPTIAGAIIIIIAFMARKILSINSNRSMNYVLKTVMAGKYNLVAVQDAFQAMAVLREKKGIQCILIDIDYQTQQNIDFIQHLKNSYLYQCPIIVLSSNKEIDDSIMNANVQDVFIKPFNPSELKKSIADAISLTLS
jgi:DNA-binding NtrC family response regulator